MRTSRRRLCFLLSVGLLLEAACQKAQPEFPSSLGETPGSESAAQATVAGTRAALSESALHIFIIDVGQGDATLIVGPGADEERFTMLIDAGNYPSTKNGAAFVGAILDYAEITYLDVVIATHFDADHIGGFVTYGSGDSLLWTFEEEHGERVCGDLPLFPWVSIANPGPGSTSPGPVEGEWHKCAVNLSAQYGVQFLVVDDDEDIETQWQLGGGYTATIVAGGGYVLGRSSKIPKVNTKNERSIAVLVSSPDGFDFLVTGDLIGQPAGNENARLEKPLGEALEARGIDIEVLRTGHHGAANATERNFVESIDPIVAVISVGNDNNHEHPRVRTHRTLDDLEGPWILQTEEGHPNEAHSFQNSEQIIVNGTIHIRVSGDSYVVESVGTQSAQGTQDTVPLHLVCDEDGCVDSH